MQQRMSTDHAHRACIDSKKFSNYLTLSLQCFVFSPAVEVDAAAPAVQCGRHFYMIYRSSRANILFKGVFLIHTPYFEFFTESYNNT